MRRSLLPCLCAALMLSTTSSWSLAQGRAKPPVIGLLEVPELMPADPCRVFAPVVLPLYASPEASIPIGQLHGSGRATATPCEFPEVRLLVGEASQPIAIEEHGYEEQSLLVAEVRGGWYRILTGATPASAWLRPSPGHVYRPLAQLYKDTLTYLSDRWDRRLYARPNGGVRLVSAGSTPERRFEPSIRVEQVTVVDGVHWARVTFVENPCDGDRGPVQGLGWVRVHDANHDRPVLWFHSRGC